MAKTEEGVQPKGCTGVLKIKIGACLTGPTRRMLRDLHDVALALNRARTRAVRAYERWREDHPDWSPPQATTRAGEPKTFRGLPVPENQPLPRHSPDLVNPQTGAAVGPETWLYHQMRAVAPMVRANIISSTSQAIYADLKDRMPYNHRGQALYRWQAILLGEATRTRYDSLTIPVPNSEAALAVSAPDLDTPGQTKVLVCGKADRERMMSMARSSAVLRFGLLSRESGRQELAVICRIEARQLTEGNRHVLRMIASGQWKFQDSQLVYEEGRGPGRGARPRRGAWFLHLVYKQPRLELGLDPDRVARLQPTPEGSHPFEVTGPAGPGPDGPRWKIGAVRTLVANHERLMIRRRVMCQRYRWAGSARRGHGRARFMRRPQEVTRHHRDLMEDFTRDLVQEVLRFCQRYNCGTVAYEEPSLMARSRSWFARKEMHYGWESLRKDLASKCSHYGIRLLVNGEVAQVA